MSKLLITDGARSRNRANAHRIRLHVVQAIERGELAPGDRLPPERELADRFGASRGTVRQALSRLERDGHIVRRVGRGTFIAKTRKDSEQREDHWREISPADVMAARILVEPEFVRLFVTQATQEDIDRLRMCIVRSEAATSFEEFERWDEALHEAIVEGTKNRLLVLFYRNVTAVRREAHWGVIKRRTFDNDERRKIEHQHRGIVDALTNRDADTARSQLLEHLQSVRRSLIEV